MTCQSAIKSEYFSIPSVLQSGVVKSADTLPLQLCLREVLGTPLARICYPYPRVVPAEKCMMLIIDF